MTTSTDLLGFDKTLDRFSAALQSGIDLGFWYGASMIVARDGKIGLQTIFGTVSPDGRAPAENHMYLMMSLSKSFTAALMMHAIDKGRFAMDTKIATVLPRFGANCKQDVTIRQLLAHTAGTFAGMVPPGLGPQALGTGEKAVDVILSLPAIYKPGTQCCYNPIASYATLAQMLVLTDPAQRSWSQIAR